MVTGGDIRIDIADRPKVHWPVMPRVGWSCVFFIVLIVGCESRSAPVTQVTPSTTPSSVAQAPGYRWVRHQAANWITYELDLAHVELSLVGQSPQEPHTLARVESYVAQQKRTWTMATNAGIFSPARRPMGLHVQRGQELAPLSTADGEGNFFLKPNGVFWIDDGGAHLAITEAYAPRGNVILATQSGPILVTKGQLHPAFLPSSTSLRTRSGVGVDGQGHVLFALSQDRVTFHAIATLFRDILGCPDALYLDGEISAIAAPHMPAPEPHEYGGLLIALKKAPP